MRLRLSDMIQWKLNELMAIGRIKNKELADFLGISPNAVSRLRRQDEMPRIDGARLYSICVFLRCEPGDLLKIQHEIQKRE